MRRRLTLRFYPAINLHICNPSRGGNPETLNDPTGRCPWCIIGAIAGAIIGGAIDYGVQVYNNYQSGSSNPWGDVNWGQVGMSALGGAIVGGTLGLAGTAAGLFGAADATVAGATTVADAGATAAGPIVQPPWRQQLIPEQSLRQPTRERRSHRILEQAQGGNFGCGIGDFDGGIGYGATSTASAGAPERATSMPEAGTTPEGATSTPETSTGTSPTGDAAVRNILDNAGAKTANSSDLNLSYNEKRIYLGHYGGNGTIINGTDVSSVRPGESYLDTLAEDYGGKTLAGLKNPTIEDIQPHKKRDTDLLIDIYLLIGCRQPPDLRDLIEQVPMVDDPTLQAQIVQRSSSPGFLLLRS